MIDFEKIPEYFHIQPSLFKTVNASIMSSWRQKAIECLTESRKDFEDYGTSIYTAFSELLPAAVNFHRTNRSDRLQKIYDFAEWCFQQKTRDLWNAAGVSFYEHLGNYAETRREMSTWVKPHIYRDQKTTGTMSKRAAITANR